MNMEIKLANLFLRFLLEVCVLAALAYWGFKNGENMLGKIGLMVGIPLLIALIWGTFGSPGAPLLLPEPWHFILEVTIFGAASVTLHAAGHPNLAKVYVFVVVLNRFLMFVWKQ
jgi:Protein of unknown function (DUF2568)